MQLQNCLYNPCNMGGLLPCDEEVTRLIDYNPRNMGVLQQGKVLLSLLQIPHFVYLCP